MTNNIFLQAVEFIWQEADMLDHGELDAWLDLWDESGLYIIPIKSDLCSEEYINHLNYAYDNATMRQLRVSRLQNGESISTHPPAKTVRTIGSFRLLEKDGQSVKIRCAQHLREYRKDALKLYSSHIEYQLVLDDGQFRILQKVVKLVNSDNALMGIGYIL